jgi:hypothetical protein
VLEAVFILLEFSSPSRRIFIGSHSLPPSLVRRIGPSHVEQLAWMLSHHIGERRVRRSYHLGMPTRRTNQLFLKPQPWQSSNQIEFTQARQKVKAQVTQPPMPLPQLTRRTSQETPLHTRKLRKISSEHLTLGNDHENKVPSRIQIREPLGRNKTSKPSSNNWDTESKLNPSD